MYNLQKILNEREMSHCSVCEKPANPAYSITYISCPHTSHAACVSDDVDVEKCTGCLSGKPLSVKTSSNITEPHTEDGIDYVDHPGTKVKSVLTKVASYMPSIRKVAPVKATPEELLKKRVPIDTIMEKHGYGLDHMLRDGIKIDDFLASGYKWNDLIKFVYISQEGTFKSLRTFANGLGLNANHLRDNPHIFPIKEFKDVTDISNGEFHSLLGLEFPPYSSLQCNGDLEWNAKHCMALGLQMSDLIDWGLKYVEQFNDLMSGLTKDEQAKVTIGMNVSDEQLAALVDLSEHKKLQRAAAAATTNIKNKLNVDEDSDSSSYVSEDEVIQINLSGRKSGKDTSSDSESEEEAAAPTPVSSSLTKISSNQSPTRTKSSNHSSTRTKSNRSATRPLREASAPMKTRTHKSVPPKQHIPPSYVYEKKKQQMKQQGL